jgi:hypothetical protein
MPRHWAGSHARGTRPVPAGPTSSQTRRRPCGLTGGNPGSATDPTSGVAVGQTIMDTPVRRVTSVAKRSQAPRVPKVGVAGGHGGSARSPKGPPRAAVFRSMESYRHTGTAGPVNREAQSTLAAVPLAPEVEDRPGPSDTHAAAFTTPDGPRGGYCRQRRRGFICPRTSPGGWLSEWTLT